MSGIDPVSSAQGIGAVVLVAGLGYAAFTDWTTREVSDRLWLILATIGALLGLWGASTHGPRAVALWLMVSALVLEHLVPWDEAVERRSASLPGALELLAYLGVLAVLVYVGFTAGVGVDSVSPVVVAVFVGVLLGRGLFELGVLYGGADAKAVIVAGILLPVEGLPLLPVPSSATLGLGVYPFALTLLMDAALLSVVVPLGLAALNVARREFEFPRGFTGFMIPVAELPERFVWLRDPTFRSDLTEEERSVSSAEEDQRLRERQRRELESRGVERVWVTPQVPFVILLAGGAVAALLFGNLIFDLAAIL